MAWSDDITVIKSAVMSEISSFCCRI